MDEGKVTIIIDGREVSQGYYTPTGQPNRADTSTFGGPGYVEGLREPVGKLVLYDPIALLVGRPLIWRDADGRNYEFKVTAQVGDLYVVRIYGPRS